MNALGGHTILHVITVLYISAEYAYQFELLGIGTIDSW